VASKTGRSPVPLLDVNPQNHAIRAELQPLFDEIIDSGRFALGPAVEQFESRFAEFTGTRHCVGLDSGTSAVHLALRAAGIGEGDEVITTPFTWISTSWAISYLGARPVYVDIDPTTFNLDVELIERAITPRTRAIVPVHLYGQAADLDGLGRVADAHGVPLIEDAAQAHGARYHERRVGSFGRAGCFSFYPSKNLGAFGEAGAVTTDDEELAARVRRLRDHAQGERHRHDELGFNARMDALQAAVLTVKLGHLDDWNAARRRVAERYRTALADVRGLVLPACATPASHVWHLFVVLADDRDGLAAALADAGIATAVHYPTPTHLQPAYAALGYHRGDLPVAEDTSRRCLSLPIYPEMADEQIESVIAAVTAALA